VIPCDASKDFSEAPSIVSLSCSARLHKIAMVANLIDDQQGKIYNTDVAFDTDGTFLAKYHKQNLWGESNIDVPDKCVEATFKTSFGVTFGMFTCADLIFEHPAVDMAKKGIHNFAIPVAWGNSMASLQVMPYAQGWSALHGVNIIISNLRSWDGSGSGIWASGQTLTSQYMPGGKTHKVIVADVPEVPEVQQNRRLLSNSVLAQSEVGSIAGDGQWQFVDLKVGHVCSGSVCCDANVAVGTTAGYVLGALDGADGQTGVRPFPAQVCAILSCSSPGRACLSHQATKGNLQSVQISMSGIADVENLIPEVLATQGSGTQQVLLTKGSAPDGFQFAHTGANATLGVSTTMKLGSALLYARLFSKDNLPYDCSSPSEVDPKIIL